MDLKLQTLNSCFCKDCLIISTTEFSSSTARIDLLFLLVEAEEIISASLVLRIDRYKDFSSRSSVTEYVLNFITKSVFLTIVIFLQHN